MSHDLFALTAVVGFLVAAMVIAKASADEGLFEEWAAVIARATTQSPTRRFALVVILIAVVTAVLTLHAAVVLLAAGPARRRQERPPRDRPRRGPRRQHRFNPAAVLEHHEPAGVRGYRPRLRGVRVADAAGLRRRGGGRARRAAVVVPQGLPAAGAASDESMRRPRSPRRRPCRCFLPRSSSRC